MDKIKELIEVYVMGAFTPDDFAGTPEEIWVELLDEAKEVYEEKGMTFDFTESDVPEIKKAVDEYLAANI